MVESKFTSETEFKSMIEELRKKIQRGYSGCYDTLIEIYRWLLNFEADYGEADELDINFDPGEIRQAMYNNMEDVHDTTKLHIARALRRIRRNVGS
jgi:hypothetical protein